MKNNFRLKAVEEKAYVTQSEYVIGVASSFVESFLFFSHERTQGGGGFTGSVQYYAER